MLSKNPNRGNGMVMKTGANVARAAYQPNPQQLYEMLCKSNERIAELEKKLQEMERCVYVGPNGDLELCSQGNMRIVAGANVEIRADVSIEARAALSIKLRDSNGNSIEMKGSGITNTAAASYHTSASTASMSTGMLTVSSGMSKFSGVVQCDTITANSVVGSSYTPGAGNVW